MRLKRLDLTRYGKFTDYSIDFGASVTDGHDFSCFYGPNEAGKSTTLTAFLDLLYGIGRRVHSISFIPIHPCRIGGVLELSGELREFVRVKRPQKSLLDQNDRPIADNSILGDVGGINRDAYRTMFSLDDETLEAGGESILQSKGDLGQLLFSASAGLAELSRRIVETKAQADGFYKYRARNGELPELKAVLAKLKEEREAIDTQAVEYTRLLETRDKAESQYKEAVKNRGQIQSRMNEIQRSLNALPRLTTLRSVRERLEPLNGLPDVPRGWGDELPHLQREETEIDVRTQTIARELLLSTEACDSIVVDETALRIADRVGRLSDLRARHVTAEKDIPERRVQLRALELKISGVLCQIECVGEFDPNRLLLGVSVIGSLRDLIERYSGIDAATRSAEHELAEAKRRLKEAVDKITGVCGEDEKGWERDDRIISLAAVVSSLRTDASETRRRLAERTLREAQADLDDCLQLMAPWHGHVDDLVGMMIPDTETIQRWKAMSQEIQKRIERHANEVERLTTEIRQHEAERDAFGGVTGLVTDQEAAAIRANRERAWAEHCDRLDADSAGRFEDVLRHDDIIMAGRLGHMSELAKLHKTVQALVVAQANYDRAVDLHSTATAEMLSLDDEIAVAVHTISSLLPHDMPLSQLEHWLTRRENTLEFRKRVNAIEKGDVLEATEDAHAAQERLMSALNGLKLAYGPKADLETLLALAQSAIDRETECRNLLAIVEERRRDVATRERAAEQAASEKQEWTIAWQQTCANCWLGEGGSPPPMSTVREILEALTELATALKDKAGFIDRIEKMERDQSAFCDEVITLANEMGIPVDSVSIIDLAQSLSDRVQRAGTERAQKVRETEQVKIKESQQQELAEAREIHEQRKTEMTSFFGVSSLAEVGLKLSDVDKRDDLRRQVDEVERDILDALGCSSIADAESILDATNRSALEEEIGELTVLSNDLDKRCHELFASHKQASDQVEAIGVDFKVATIEERRRTILLEIEDGAARYLRLRAGIVATEQALRIYRERHRSSMMARASDALRTISRGAYTGLTTQVDKDNDVLIAIGSDGSSKLATEMSKGTRFQLYLALRVAGFYEFARARSPAPFIADDIMETFDDFRAEETFRLFAEMAKTGQVIYLTHHRHLCEIAQQVCPTVQIHHLPEQIVTERKTA